MEEVVSTRYNEETDSHEVRVRGKLVINVSPEDLDIIEGEGLNADSLWNDLLLDLSMKDGV